jgi:hypothetical protein
MLPPRVLLHRFIAVTGWLSPLIAYGRTNGLKPSDLYALEPGQATAETLEAFNAQWRAAVDKHGDKASLGRTLMQVYWRDIAWAILMVSLSIGFSILTPAYFSNQLIILTNQESPTWSTGLPLAFGLFVSELLRNTFMTQYWLTVTYVGSKMRAIVIGEL